MGNEKKYGGGKSRNISIMLILSAVIIFLVSYLVFREDQFKQISQNQYSKSFYELINYTENIETMLAKSLVAKSAEYSAQNLANVWREANLAQDAISSIPINANILENANNFLNQVSDYSYTLTKECIYGKELKEEQTNNLKSLYQNSIKLQEQLQNVSSDIEAGIFTWDSITRTGNKIFNKDYENVQVDFINNVNNDLQNYSGLIYDGAFSDHVTQIEPKGLGENEISEEEAKQLIKKFLQENDISEIISNGIQGDKLQVYNFSVKLKDNTETATISIPKKGGQVLYMSYNKDIAGSTIDVEKAKQLGKQYLENVGFNSMQATYYVYDGNSVIINYANIENNVLMYPDLVKLKIALDDGKIIGIEANGYIYNHHERKTNNNIISINDAREKISTIVTIETEQLVIIPTDWKTEILCYEFKGKVEDKEYLIYINAENGQEEKIYILLEDDNGIMTI